MHVVLLLSILLGFVGTVYQKGVLSHPSTDMICELCYLLQTGSKSLHSNPFIEALQRN